MSALWHTVRALNFLVIPHSMVYACVFSYFFFFLARYGCDVMRSFNDHAKKEKVSEQDLLSKNLIVAFCLLAKRV